MARHIITHIRGIVIRGYDLFLCAAVGIEAVKIFGDRTFAYFRQRLNGIAGFDPHCGAKLIFAGFDDSRSELMIFSAFPQREGSDFDFVFYVDICNRSRKAVAQVVRESKKSLWYVAGKKRFYGKRRRRGNVTVIFRPVLRIKAAFFIVTG